MTEHRDNSHNGMTIFTGGFPAGRAKITMDVLFFSCSLSNLIGRAELNMGDIIRPTILARAKLCINLCISELAGWQETAFSHKKKRFFVIEKNVIFENFLSCSA